MLRGILSILHNSKKEVRREEKVKPVRNQNINIFFVQAQSTAVPPSGGYRVAGLSVASRDRVQSGKVNAATNGLSA